MRLKEPEGRRELHVVVFFFLPLVNDSVVFHHILRDVVRNLRSEHLLHFGLVRSGKGRHDLHRPDRLDVVMEDLRDGRRKHRLCACQAVERMDDFCLQPVNPFHVWPPLC